MDTAQRLLNEIDLRLPHASLSIDALRSILAEPDPSSIDEALSALPFNYH